MKKFTLLLTALSLILAGCSNTQYLLRSTTPVNTGLSAQDSNFYAIRSIKLPDYLSDQPNIIYINSQNTTKVYNSSVWVENLAANMRTVIAQDISQTVPYPVYNYPIPPNSHPIKIIDINVTQFIANKQENQLNFAASWQINSPETQTTKNYALMKNYPLSDFSPQGIVKGYQLAVDALSQAISTSLH